MTADDASLRHRSKRGRKHSLSVIAIAAAALEVADVDGLDAVTMKRVAQELGVAAMTLYGYVRTKEEILAAMTEVAMAELQLTGMGPWDVQLADFFGRIYIMLIRHPAVALLNARQPLIVGPMTLPVIERGLALVRAGGLEGADAVRAFRSLLSFTLGSALYHASRQGPATSASLEQRKAAWRAATPDRYPSIASLTEELASEGTSGQFETGLAHLVAGIRGDAPRRPHWPNPGIAHR